MSLYYYKILLIGPTGGGKTYSFRNLDRETTGFINIENKPLPFKGAFKNEKIPKNHYQVLELLERVGASNLSSVLVDSFSAYVDMVMAEARRTKKGYDIFNFYNEQIGKFNDIIKNIQKEVFVTAHYEYVGDELTGAKEKRAKVKGKEWEGKYNVLVKAV